MGREKMDVGRSGEKAAHAILSKRGYRIIGSNVRTPFGELDLVAKYKGWIVFVEVRTRTSSSLGPPCLSITRIKKRHLIHNALFYLKVHGLLRSNWRIDVVSVKMDLLHKIENIEIIENAVEEE